MKCIIQPRTHAFCIVVVQCKKRLICTARFVLFLSRDSAHKARVLAHSSSQKLTCKYFVFRLGFAPSSADRCHDSDGAWPRPIHDDDVRAHFIVKVADPAVRRGRSSVTTSRRGSPRLSASTCSRGADARLPYACLLDTDTVPHRATAFNHFPFWGKVDGRAECGGDLNRERTSTSTAAAEPEAYVTSAPAISWPLLQHVTSDVISRRW